MGKQGVHIQSRRIWEAATRMRWAPEMILPVAAWAEEARMTVRTFHRLFREVIGEPPTTHLQRLRLERAAAHLMYTDDPVADAAAAGGYDSREGFVRIFRARFHCTPTEYRRRARRVWHGKPRDPPPGMRKPSVVRLPPMRVAAIPYLGPSLESGPTWLRLARWAQAAGLWNPQKPAFGIVFDDDDITPAKKVRLDAAVAVNADFKPRGTDPVIAYDLPGGDHVAADFIGSLTELHDAWNYFSLQWFPASHFHLRDSFLLNLFPLEDIPATPQAMARLENGHPLRGQLCIPISHILQSGLPVRHARPL